MDIHVRRLAERRRRSEVFGLSSLLTVGRILVNLGHECPCKGEFDSGPKAQLFI